MLIPFFFRFRHLSVWRGAPDDSYSRNIIEWNPILLDRSHVSFYILSLNEDKHPCKHSEESAHKRIRRNSARKSISEYFWIDIIQFLLEIFGQKKCLRIFLKMLKVEELNIPLCFSGCKVVPLVLKMNNIDSKILEK